ncbi:hypothetical protein N7493_006745 [Penicillium malachiteum]|uniref:Uncharacterized protein n=1 Tax=Penicillium malachiteum TaxID=1324776 RepID=A0AAD6HJM8_9EURO|nr:hypothetical protein N7493_006745 [Penicillium malachiteum]
MATFNEYLENLAVDCQLAVDQVIEMLKIAGFSEVDIQTSNSRSFHQVMAQRMAQIATKLQCNPTNYVWRWDFPSQIVRKGHLKEIALYDPNVNTTVLDPFESYDHLDEQDIIGYSIFTIFPTLIKVVRRGDFWGMEFRDIEHTICNGWVIMDLDGGHPGIDVPKRIEFPTKYSISPRKHCWRQR